MATLDLQGYVSGQIQSKIGDAQAIAAKVEALPADAKAEWDAATTPEANDARIAQGAQDASDLLQNGYNPDNQDDNKKLLGAVAAGCALIPGIGWAIGAAVALLAAAAYVIAPFLYKWGLLAKPLFTTTGNFSPNQAFSLYTISANQPNTFANLALNALAQVWADKNNGKATPYYSDVVAGIAALWNAHSSGPQQMLWVPYFNDVNTTPIFSATLGGSALEIPGTRNANPLGMPGDVDLAVWAFMPYDQAAKAGMAPYGFGVTVNSGPFQAPPKLRITATVARARKKLAAQAKGQTAIAKAIASKPATVTSTPVSKNKLHRPLYTGGGAVAGFMVGGPIGAAVGAAIGYFLGK